MNVWSEQLDAYIARTKLSKKRLASELGISIKTLEKWWGSREPSSENIARIRKLLGGDTSAVMSATDKSLSSSVKESVKVEKAVKGKKIGKSSTDETPFRSHGAPELPDRTSVDEAMAEQLAGEGGRYGQVPVVVSLSRTVCPFCTHEVTKFRNCVYCGQHFTWANIPVRHDAS